MATVNGNDLLLKASRVWSPDVVPNGLDALSYERGDGVGDWSYPTTETGSLGEDSFGLHTGTMSQGFAWKNCPAGEFSITTYVAASADNVQFRTPGILLGNNLNGSGSFSYYTWKLEIDGSDGAIRFQRWVNGGFQANMLGNSTFTSVNGVYLRVGVNAAQTSTTAWTSLDGITWLDWGTATTNAFTFNQIGLLMVTNRDTRVPWFRVRTGAGEATNEAPEGGLN